MIRYPKEIKAQSVCKGIICDVDFAPTLLNFANARIRAYMQGVSFRCKARRPKTGNKLHIIGTGCIVTSSMKHMRFIVFVISGTS